MLGLRPICPRSRTRKFSKGDATLTHNQAAQDRPSPATTGVGPREGVIATAAVLILLVLASQVFAEIAEPPSDTQPRTLSVARLKITGNHTIQTAILKRQMRLQWRQWYERILGGERTPQVDATVLDDDLSRLKSYYNSVGFPDVRVTAQTTARRDGATDVLIHVDEGSATIVASVSIAGLDQAPEVQWSDLRHLLALEPGIRFQSRFADLDQLTIQNYVRDRGYAYADVRASVDPDPARHRVAVAFAVTPGPVCRFGKPVFGSAIHDESTVLREVAFRPDERYSLRKIETTQMQIYRLGLFHYVSVEPMLPVGAPTDTVNVIVHLRSRQRRSVKVGVGWSTDERYRGSLLLEDRSFFGGARRVNLTARASAVSEVDLSFRQPYLFDNKNDIVAGSFAKDEKQPQYRARTFGGSLTLSREISRFLSGSIEYRYEFVKSTATTAGAPEPEGFSNIPRLRLKLIRNSSDDLFNPTSGSSATLVADRTGVVFPSEVVYFRTTFDGRWYRRSYLGTVVAFRGALGVLHPIQLKRPLFDSDLFYAGGASSVRGWKRQRLTEFGGNGLLETSVELRFPLLLDFAGAVFLDGGNVWRGAKQIDATDLKYAAGWGLRYLTAVGPVRLDLGCRLAERRPLKKRVVLHFSVGQAF